MEPIAGIAALFGLFWLITKGGPSWISFMGDEDARANRRGVYDMRTGELIARPTLIEDEDEPMYEFEEEWEEVRPQRYRAKRVRRHL